MQQAKLVGSSQMPSSPVIHPRVQRALSNLDSRLEDELARYRRHRAGLKVSPSSVQVLHPKPKPKSSRVELASFVPLTVPETPAQETGTAPGEFDRAIPEATTSQVSGGLSIAPHPAAIGWDHAPNSEEVALTEPDIAPEDYLESSEELLRSLAEEEAQVEAERGVLENLLTPLGVGSMLLMLLASGMFGYLIMNPKSLQTMAEVLGRSLSALQPKPVQNVAQAPKAADSATSGADASDSFALESPEFADLSLNSLTALRTNRASVSPIVPPGGKLGPNLPANAAPVLGVTIGSGIQPPTGNAKPTPTLAAMGTAPESSSLFSHSVEAPAQRSAPSRPQVPAVSSSYSFSEPPAPRSTPAVRHSGSHRGARPTPPPVEPSLPPAPSSIPSIAPSMLPSMASSPSPAPTSEYKVVVPYDSDRTLEKAQQLDPGAFFRNGSTGAVIQMGGGYRSEAEAQQKAQQLKQQGFDAEVQK